jgi:serine/threonine-protein kinase
VADIGTILGGRYRVVAQLGQGGMATIYRAIDTQLGREVAVKLLRPEYLRDPDFSSRFRQEAQNAASLSHPNVVTVYDYGEDPSGPFIVMEYVDGEDLATILRRNAPLPPVQSTRIASAVARALDAAHKRGIIHRDVKPGNVLIGRDGRVKVVDFGIARAIAEAQMTLPGTTLGSVHYFSPEQARGEPATASSDIFALGIVLYEMLTGSRPWEGDSAASVALARLHGPVPDPALIRPSIPPALALVARTAMAQDPEDRYATAGAMADALDATLPASAGVAAAGPPAAGVAAGAAAAAGIASANPTMAYPPDAYAGADDVSPPPAEPPAEPPAPVPVDEEEGTSPVVWIAGAIAVLLLAAVAFLVFQLLSSPSETVDEQVTLPNFVGRLIEDATREADGLGITLIQTPEETTDQPPGTILAQDPPAESVVDTGSQVRVTVATGLTQVPAPDLRTKTEAQAVAELINAGLRPGTKTEAFDETVPVGIIVSQNPNPGVLLARDSPVDYVVSRGPEPTPTPTPTPTLPPTPTPTAPPTPTPTPEPTPPPTAPPPTAVFDCAVSGLSVDCDASGSSEATTWTWDFGDGESGSGETATHDYAAAGDYTITLTVENADGAEDSDSASFTVGP